MVRFLVIGLCAMWPWLSRGQVDTVVAQRIVVEARQIIDTLCSPTLGGRGYVGDGHKRAAKYLADRFEELGLTPRGDQGTYVQGFPIQINLPTRAKVSLDGHPLQAGRDFIVDGFSGSGKITGAKVKDVGYALEKVKKLQGCVVIFRSGFPPEIANDSEQRERYKDLTRDDQRISRLLKADPAAVIILQSKLTAGFTREQFPVPVIEMQVDSIPRKVKRASLDIDSDISLITSGNVLGVIPGTAVPDSFVVLTAHYDHLGQYEDAIFTGANDNASGVSMMLSLLDHFVAHPLRYSLLCIAFGGEETGLIGSRYYVERDPKVPLDKMRFLLNLDLMGNGDEGIMAVGGKEFSTEFEQLTALNDSLKAVPKVRARKNAPNSDHFFFLRKGVRGFFIYTLGGPPHYHDVNDNPSTILLSRFVEVRELLIQLLEQIR